MSNQSLEQSILQTTLIRLGKYFQDVVRQKQTDGKPRQLIPAHITSNDRFSVFEYAKKQKESSNNIFPFFGFSLDTLSINRNNTSRNVGAHYRAGEHVKNGTGNLFSIIRTIPVEFTCNLIFLTDDYWESLDFSAKVLFATVDKSVLDFEYVFNSVRFSIKMEMSEEVTFPPKDNTLDIANYFEFNTSFKIQAYISGNKDFKDLETVTAVEKIFIYPALVSNEYAGLEFITEDSSPSDFYIDDGHGGYEKVIIELN